MLPAPTQPTPASPQDFFLGTRTFSEVLVTKSYIEDPETQSQIFTTSLRLPTAPLFTLLMVHGFTEHSSRHIDFGMLFAKEGGEVLLFDLRGSGHSSGHRFSASLKQYYQDFLLMISKASKAVPLFIFGHSMGGAIALSFLAKNPNVKVAGAILSAPFTDIPSYVKMGLLSKLAILALPKVFNVE